MKTARKEHDKFGEQNIRREVYDDAFLAVVFYCIKNYDGVRPFLNYFRTSLDKQIASRAAIERVYQDSGMKIPRQTVKLLPKLKKYCRSRGKDVEDIGRDISLEQAAASCGIDVEPKEIEKLLALKKISSLDAPLNDKGEIRDEDNDSSLEELIKDNKNRGIINPREDIEQFYREFSEGLKRIGDLVSTLQKRQIPILSQIMTVNILKFLNSEFDKKRIYDIISENNIPFLDETIYKAFLQGEKLPSLNDIALRFNKSLPSVSRTKKIFIDKLNKAYPDKNWLWIINKEQE